MVNMRKLMLAVLVAALAWGAFWRPGQAGSALPQQGGTGVQGGGGSLDFNRAAELAIRQSPFFTKSALEIEVRHLDESDSRWGVVPSITLRTRYFVNRPDVAGLNARPYAVDFLAEDYNPLEAYISLQVRKLLTKIAVLSHLQVISQGLHRLARGFLQLDNLNRLAAVQQELVHLAEKNLAYTQELLKLGKVALLEVKAASQELELAQLEKRRLEEAQADLRQALKSFLGVKAEERLTFDLRLARQQILGDFDAGVAPLEKAQDRSYELKIQHLKKELQARNVSLARTKLLPTIFFGVQTPDPLSLVDAHGYYFSVGLKFPVWDGFRRVRNISRQKTILQQYNADQELKELDFGDKWREAKDHLRQAATELQVSQGKEELARLKARQGEIRYQAGDPLGLWLEGRKAHLEAQRQTALKSLDHELAVLAVRHLSGDVVPRYLHEPSIREQ
jgi:outer membrane protein TolC